MVRFEEGRIDGLTILEFPLFGDSRGEWRRVSEIARFDSGSTPDNLSIRQVSVSVNRVSGTVRGLHFLDPNLGEYKNVSCIRGSVLDVVVDLRRDSPTFGKIAKIALGASSATASVVIPPGCAHGFQTLQDDTILTYSMTADYQPELDFGVNALDPDLGISWPLPVGEISHRDLALPRALEYLK